MLSEKWKSTLKKVAQKLTGYKKRAFMAEVTEDYFDGSPRKAETQLGWSRQAIATGLKERETGRESFVQITIKQEEEKKRKKSCRN